MLVSPNRQIIAAHIQESHDELVVSDFSTFSFYHNIYIKINKMYVYVLRVKSIFQFSVFYQRCGRRTRVIPSYRLFVISKYVFYKIIARFFYRSQFCRQNQLFFNPSPILPCTLKFFNGFCNELMVTIFPTFF